MKLLIIIPTFNERENILPLIDRLLTLHANATVLVVDDGSPDGTGALVREAESKYGGRLQLLERDGKGGRGSAVLEGFRYALREGYDLIMEMDADFSHDPGEVGRFLEKMNTYDLVIGSRYLPGSQIHDWGWKRTFFSAWANRYARLILGIPLSDYTNGFRCYTRRAIAALDMDRIDAKGYVVLSEVAYQLHRKGIGIGEVPITFVNRRRGISNIGYHEIHEAFFSVLRIRSPDLAMHVGQALKFGLCGGGGAMIDFGVLHLLVRYALWPEKYALLVSGSFALLFVFLTNRFFTFRGRGSDPRRAAAKFLVVYLTAAFLNYWISLGLIWAGVHYLLAKAIAIGIIMCFNYVLLHSFVFPDH